MVFYGWGKDRYTVLYDFSGRRTGTLSTVHTKARNWIHLLAPSNLTQSEDDSFLGYSDEFVALMMEARRTSEMLVCCNKTTRRNITEGCHTIPVLVFQMPVPQKFSPVKFLMEFSLQSELHVRSVLTSLPLQFFYWVTYKSLCSLYVLCNLNSSSNLSP
jgi:hypothetical protein